MKTPMKIPGTPWTIIDTADHEWHKGNLEELDDLANKLQAAYDSNFELSMRLIGREETEFKMRKIEFVFKMFIFGLLIGLMFLISKEIRKG